ncbi:MAG: hypothetical protein U0103_08005 [Candidatus Obscuribacterales bacterium]|nr:hypothetical protein [Cyanobacteria bacterium SZAS LIN-5]RTL39277.1 MAG: hypothetical protein EKK48_19725 [Candidatus Melainabacteria bacterium]
MKYLHSGYLLFCEKADHRDDGRIDALGLYDLFVAKELPIAMNSWWVLGFGTPYERRQYKGSLTLENPSGEIVFQKEFSANDPADIFKGHYIFKPEIILDKEGCWTAKATLRNWKDESMWDVERRFWTMLETDSPPDP